MHSSIDFFSVQKRKSDEQFPIPFSNSQSVLAWNQEHADCISAGWDLVDRRRSLFSISLDSRSVARLRFPLKVSYNPGRARPVLAWLQYARRLLGPESRLQRHESFPWHTD